MYSHWPKGKFFYLSCVAEVSHLEKTMYYLQQSQPQSTYTVGAQSITRAQSIAPRHSTYVITPKKPKFRKFLFGKTKKEEFARRFFKKTSVFSGLKL